MNLRQWRTYSIVAIPGTHDRLATCAEVECEAHRNGFAVTVDPGTELGKRQYDYLHADQSRHSIETRGPGGVVTFTYPAGQTCMVEHRVPVDRPHDFYRRTGRNGSYTDSYQHADPAHWVEDLNTNQDRVSRLING